MTHDPLCPVSSSRCGGRDGKHHSLWPEPPAECEKCGAECQCELIAKVRADQIERDATIVKDFGWSPETDDADMQQVLAELREQ